MFKKKKKGGTSVELKNRANPVPMNNCKSYPQGPDGPTYSNYSHRHTYIHTFKSKLTHQISENS